MEDDKRARLGLPAFMRPSLRCGDAAVVRSKAIEWRGEAPGVIERTSPAGKLIIPVRAKSCKRWLARTRAVRSEV